MEEQSKYRFIAVNGVFRVPTSETQDDFLNALVDWLDGRNSGLLAVASEIDEDDAPADAVELLADIVEAEDEGVDATAFMIRRSTPTGEVDLSFSHLVSTPLGDFAIFVESEPQDPEDPGVGVYKLTPPTEQELDFALEMWAQMVRQMGEEEE